MCGQTVEDECDSLLMPVCGSVVGGGEPLNKWNGLPWEHFIQNQCGGRRGRYRRDNLVERGGGRETQRQNA